MHPIDNISVENAYWTQAADKWAVDVTNFQMKWSQSHLEAVYLLTSKVESTDIQKLNNIF